MRPVSRSDPRVSKIGRNDPCPCGSGKKYKKCHLLKQAVAVRFSRDDRTSALAKLEHWSMDHLGEEDDEAYEELWGEQTAELEGQWNVMSESVSDAWFWFDRPLGDGRLVVDLFLAEGTPLSAAERCYLERMRASSMRLYDIQDVRPGLSVTLEDVLDGARVTVREQSFSRSAQRAELVAARIISAGISGEPEIDLSLLHIPALLRRGIIEQVTRHRAEFRRENPRAPELEFWKEMPPFFHSAWVSAILNPPLPTLKTTDGEDVVWTRVHFDVLDAYRLPALLDGIAGFERDGDQWHWSGTNVAGKEISLGQAKIKDQALVLETMSAERSQRGRGLLEGAAGDAIRHRATTHEDPTVSIREALRKGEVQASAAQCKEELPRELVEDLTLDHYARYYRKWLDEPVPALDDRTPRDAARDAAYQARVAELIHGLEGLYQGALRADQPAYDPSWMWEELGLSEAAPAHPPPLAHERFADAVPGLAELRQQVAERLRKRPGFDDASSLTTPDDITADLDLQRFVRDHSPEQAAGISLAAHLPWMLDFELHRKKTFWVDGALSYLLGQTDFAVLGDDLRVPFPSFALVFTDRYALSLAERLVASNARSPIRGHILRVMTVYVTEEQAPPDRVLHLRFAVDALGADPPQVIEHAVRVRPLAPVELPSSPAPRAVLTDGEPVLPAQRPLPGLVHLALNAILYSTSAGVEPQLRPAPLSRAGRAPAQEATSTEGVFFLPGSIEISRLRQMQALERIPSGRQVLHRFMVRGHWRRPPKSWQDQRLRWIEPYWKGPDLAAVIERTYKLTP